MNLSPQKLMREMAHVDLLNEMLGEDADPKLFLDTIAGETDALECVDALIEMILRDQLLANKASERVSRLEARAEKRRATLLAIMEEKLHMQKLERPLATTWITHTTPTARVIDQDQLPSEYLRTAVDTAKLSKALRNGATIPGAELNNPRPVLNVRGV